MASPPEEGTPHPDVSSPHAEDSTYQPDPQAPSDARPPDGPHVEQVRGDAAGGGLKSAGGASSQSASSSRKSSSSSSTSS